MIVIRQLDASAIARIADIDRSEHVTGVYSWHDGRLEPEEVDWQVPTWPAEGNGEYSVQANIADWRPFLEELDGVMFGAMYGRRLVGFAIYRPRLEPDMGQLAVLHVSREYRRQGLGAALAEQVAMLALADGARRLYVSATPTAGTVEFYRSLGFHPVDEPHPELFALEPDDIHRVREL
ncbi:MAG: GNAT family N-acetyltransferase [Anaerolineae bacterium]